MKLKCVVIIEIGHLPFDMKPDFWQGPSLLLQGVALEVAESVVAALTDKPVTTAVNAPLLPKEVIDTMLPYASLAEALGSVAVQMADGGVDSVKVYYSCAYLQNPKLDRALHSFIRFFFLKKKKRGEKRKKAGYQLSSNPVLFFPCLFLLPPDHIWYYRKRFFHPFRYTPATS